MLAHYTRTQTMALGPAVARRQASRFADTAALFHALDGGWWNRADSADNAN
jgi:hypothetical protein